GPPGGPPTGPGGGARQLLRSGELRGLVPAVGHLTALLAAGWTVQGRRGRGPCVHATIDRVLVALSAGRSVGAGRSFPRSLRPRPCCRSRRCRHRARGSTD